MKEALRVQSADWSRATELAEATLSGVTRGRVPGSAEGVELAYLDWGGEGAVILMHHANGFCGATLAPLAARLRDRYRVISLDARGHGDSTAVDAGADPGAYAWQVLIDDLAAAATGLLERTGIERFRLGLGHSFGGALMMAAASAAESVRPLFDALILADPVLIPKMKDADRIKYVGRSPMVAAARRRRAHFDSGREAYERFATRPLFAGFRPESLALYVQEGFRPAPDGGVVLKCHPDVEAAVFSGPGQVDFEAAATQLEVPTLILRAAQGDFSRALYDDLAARMEHGRVEEFDGGHLFPMEVPDALAERISAELAPQ